jgi:hypothetical protein
MAVAVVAVEITLLRLQQAAQAVELRIILVAHPLTMVKGTLADLVTVLKYLGEVAVQEAAEIVMVMVVLG